MYLVLGRQNCTFCDKAKELLEFDGLDYVYVDIMDKPELKDILVEQINVRTVPQVFKLVGGYDHLKVSLDGE